MATLLVVDDDNTVRDTLCAFFGETHECHSADRAEQALAFLEFEHYDVILTDLAMPGLDGQQLLKRVHQTHPETPVIIISGKCTDEEGQSSIALGAFAYLKKPFRLEDIAEIVNRALEK
jgi:two-component system, NtrC family, nitrogen regulation response regulator GlnG